MSETRDAVRVLVVDDHPLWRDALARDLDAAGLPVVGTAGSVAETLRILPAVRPTVIVLDLRLPDGTGVDVVAALPGTLPGSPLPHVLVLSATGERDEVLAAVREGASGYLLKSARPDELVDAVRRTAQGEAVFTPGLAGMLLGEYRRLSTAPAPGPSGAPRLTERETEVLRLVAKGLTSREVAERLHLSHRTVQNHTQSTLRKLQLSNRVELTRWAIREGLD